MDLNQKEKSGQMYSVWLERASQVVIFCNGAALVELQTHWLSFSSSSKNLLFHPLTVEFFYINFSFFNFDNNIMLHFLAAFVFNILCNRITSQTKIFVIFNFLNYFLIDLFLDLGSSLI